MNAEKVIVKYFNITIDETDKANDLKKVIAKLLKINILIDEVRHATADDIKLTQAINYWNKNGNLCAILGFSGTPYLPKLMVTVCHYPLVKTIQRFLKKPTVKVAKQTQRLSILTEGVKDLNLLYGNKKYQNGAIAKLAIYCGNIKTLEKEAYPYLINEIGINPTEILKYHKGNSAFVVKPDQETEFLFLNQQQLKKKYILLVQVGKEGWDCPSLTGVILAQKGDSPQNMVLQTACSCLRQVDAKQQETAVIWVNQENANTLNKQLNREQNTSNKELNSLFKKEIKPVEIAVNHDAFTVDKLTTDSKPPKTDTEITLALEKINVYLPRLKSSAEAKEKEKAQFYTWLYQINCEGFALTLFDSLLKFQEQLRKIFENSTLLESGNRYFNLIIHSDQVAQQIWMIFNSSKSF